MRICVAITCLAFASTSAAETLVNSTLPTTDFSKPEEFEQLQGGLGTNRELFDHLAFSQPSSVLSDAERSDFFVGNGVFDRPWVAAPSDAKGADGLGPFFNATSCEACHIRDGRGRPPEPGANDMVSIIFVLSDQEGQPDPLFGDQLQDHAIGGFESEGQVSVTYQDVPFVYPDGSEVVLRKPSFSTNAQLSTGVSLNPRMAQPMIGLGPVEAISEVDLLANADPNDADGDGVSGRAQMVDDRIGRFGWKATVATLRDQSAIAFRNDMGLSTSRLKGAFGDCTAAQLVCRNAVHGGEPEVSDQLLDLVTFYSANLAVPSRRDIDDPDVLAGKALFYEAQCTSCHVPKFQTRAGTQPNGQGQLIWPYSDFLLHDMGPGLADKTPTGDIRAAEWRTPPLWGIGLTEVVSGHTSFLHDGRARSLEEAILWHGGEGEASRDAFAALQSEERAQLIQFLESL